MSQQQLFWNVQIDELIRQLETTPQGLSREEARRLDRLGPNLLKPRKETGAFTLLLSQSKSPIILILIFAGRLSFLLHAPVEGFITLSIILASGLLGFWQERGISSDAVERLMAMVQIKAAAVREGQTEEVPVEEIVPGDVVLLNAGDSVLEDGRIIESKDLFVDEATLTGETYPVEKTPGLLSAETPLGHDARGTAKTGNGRD